jgi:Arc/MetJ family transcription regulator
VKTKRVVSTTVKRTVRKKVKKTGKTELSDREAEEERISKKKRRRE